jgi:hypothetical protein
MDHAATIIKAVANIVAVAGVLFAVWKGLEELKRQRKQRDEELALRRMEIAQKLLEAFGQDEKAKDATLMMDWTGRAYQIAPGITATISWQDVQQGLRIHSTTSHFNQKEVYIRDCMDAFLLHAGAMARTHRRGLIELDDLRDGIGYYLKRADQQLGKALYDYMEECDLTDAARLFKLLLPT